jgi:hypothetical protein
MSVWFGGKLSVNLCVPVEERIIVIKAKVGEFRQWVEVMGKLLTTTLYYYNYEK